MPRKGGRKTKWPKAKIPHPNPAPERKMPDFESLNKDVPYARLSPVFSFRYYDHSHNKYSAKKIKKADDSHLMLKRLQMYCSMTWGQLEAGDYHAHDFTGNTSKEKHGFSSKLKIPGEYPPYQFQAFAECRIVGFHMSKVFYVVWFDRNHQIYPS